MNIYLGTAGSEDLLPANNRKFDAEDFEVSQDLRTADGTLYKYVAGIKHRFTISYRSIIGSDLKIITDLYALKTILNLKIERREAEGTYDEYSVLFARGLPRSLQQAFGGWRYENISFVLEEV